MKKFFPEDFTSPLENFFEDFMVDVRKCFSKTFADFKNIALPETPSRPTFKYHGNSLRVSLPLPSGCAHQDVDIQVTRDGYLKVSGSYRSKLEGNVSHSTLSRNATRELYEGYFVKSFYIGEGLEYLGAHTEQGVLYCDFRLSNASRLSHSPASLAAPTQNTGTIPRLREGSYNREIQGNTNSVGQKPYFLQSRTGLPHNRIENRHRALPRSDLPLLESPHDNKKGRSLIAHSPYENNLGVNRASRYFRNNKERQRL